MCSVFVWQVMVHNMPLRGAEVLWVARFHHVLGHNSVRVFKYSYMSLTNHTSLRPADYTTHLLFPTFVSILRPNLFTKTLTLAHTNICGSICRANMHCMLIHPEDICNARVIYCRDGTYARASSFCHIVICNSFHRTSSSCLHRPFALILIPPW